MYEYARGGRVDVTLCTEAGSLANAELVYTAVLTSLSLHAYLSLMWF